MSAATENQGSARRALRALFVLQGHAFQGLRLKDVAAALETSATNALRTLQVLADEGLAERTPGNDECWRLSPRLVQIARAHEHELARLRQRLDETEQRYSRDPN